MSAWIDLNRLLLPADTPEQIPSLAALPFLPKAALTWTEVLASPCVALLGEAGSGKTSKLRAQAERLVKEGRAAFFLRVDDLAKDGLEAAIEGDRDALDRWSQGSTEGWFFLDSVDEAKLHRETLRRAAAKLEVALQSAISRCHVVVSCRHSDWHPDDEEVLRRLADKLVKPPAPPPEEARPVLRVRGARRSCRPRRVARRCAVMRVDSPVGSAHCITLTAPGWSVSQGKTSRR